MHALFLMYYPFLHCNKNTSIASNEKKKEKEL
jgi:hypothetical protein